MTDEEVKQVKFLNDLIANAVEEINYCNRKIKSLMCQVEVFEKLIKKITLEEIE